MLNFELPATGRERSPAFLAASECRAWMDRIPLTNASLAQPLVRRQLELLHGYDLPVPERLGILEALRGTVCKLQDDAARGFAARPLPFSPAEQQAFDATLDVWELLALGYLRCFAGVEGQAPDALALRARLAQRTLSIFADWQVDLCRGEQLPDPGYWRRVHQVVSACEAAGIATVHVSDPVRHGLNSTSPVAAYAECNLLASASLYELPARHLGWVARWARRWGGKLALLDAAPVDIRNRAVPLWVDLDADLPPSYQPRPADRGRWLETTELRRSLAARIERLERGEAPAALQLGDDVTQPAALQLLRRMLQRWCQGGSRRMETRRAINGSCGVVVGFEAAYRELSGGVKFVADRNLSTLRREREEFEVFGDLRQRVSRVPRNDTAVAESWDLVDEWQLLNQSPGGLRIRRGMSAGARVGAGLLVAIRIGEGGRYSLAAVRWALRDGIDALTAGIQCFPGEPLPVGVRILDGDGSAQWRQAFCLPSDPSLDVPETLVLRPGSFRLDRRVELRLGDDIRIMKLCGILDHGNDFERCLVRMA